MKEDIKSIKLDFVRFAKSKYMHVKKGIDSQIHTLQEYERKLSLDSYYKQSQYASKAVELLIEAKEDINNNILLENKDILRRMNKVYLQLKRIKFEEAISLKNLELNYVKLKSRKEALYIITAPLLFIANLTKFEKLKLKQMGVDSPISGYYHYKSAKFVVFDTSVSDDYITRINSYITVANKQIRNSVVPIHDINKETNGYYIVLLIPENYAKYWEKVIGKKYTIYVEI